MHGIDALAGEPPYFIPEAGVNHNGNLETAESLIDVAAEAGADAVKFQTFAAERLVTADAGLAAYQTKQVEKDSQREMLKQYELSRSQHKDLMTYAEEREITFLSTPFGKESADMLADLGVEAIKLGSGELDNYPLLEHAAGLGLPMIVSTGMGTIDEVVAAHEVIQSVAPELPVVFLHCVSAYPTPLKEANLLAMRTMDERLPCPVGFSDHTMSTEIPGIAVAAGATVVEKHFTLDRSMDGPDHHASLEPDELEDAINFVDTVVTVLGNKAKQPAASEEENIETVRKGIYASRDLETGETIGEDDIGFYRPAAGISPSEYERVVGSEVVKSVSKSEPITEAVLTGGE
jgi:N-acetylneuraminate synthase/N,N'-diacetyllegionaminate synthase